MIEHSFGCIADQEAMGLYDLSKAQVYQKPEEMTEALKREAEEYAIDNYELIEEGQRSDQRAREEAYFAGAEPREKLIYI